MAKPKPAKKKAEPDVIWKGESNLLCLLTADEMAERRLQLVDSTKERGRREHDLEGWKATKREEQKLFEGEIVSVGARCVRLARYIEDGKEPRQVKIEHHMDAGQVNVVRLDTGEVISSRPAMEHELQRTLPGVEPELPGAEPESEATHSALEDEYPMLPPPAEAEEGPPPVRHVEGFDDPEPPRDIDGVKSEPTPADEEHDLEWDGIGGSG